MVKFAKALVVHADDFSDVIEMSAYMDYKSLKKTLKFSPDEFFSSFETELFKVRDFIDNKASQFVTLYQCSAGDTIVLDCALKKQIKLTSRAVEAIEGFTRMNREGFRKILKKYDKVTGKSVGGERMSMVNGVLSDPISELDLLISSARPAHLEGKDEDTSTLKRYAQNNFVRLGVFLITVTVFGLVLAFGVKGTAILNVFVIGIVASFTLALANGANDIANCEYSPQPQPTKHPNQLYRQLNYQPPNT